MLKTVSNNLKFLRNAHNLSEEQIAIFLNCDVEDVIDFESECKPIGLCLLNKLSDLYNIELEDILIKDYSKSSFTGYDLSKIEISDLIQVANFYKIMKNYCYMKNID